MFCRNNRPWNAFNKLVIVDYKILGTAFAAILKHMFSLETGVFFLAQYLQFTIWKIGAGEVKRRKGSLASDKTLVWLSSNQNLIHTDI